MTGMFNSGINTRLDDLKKENQTQRFQMEILNADLYEVKKERDLSQNMKNQSDQRNAVTKKKLEQIQKKLNQIKECSICMEGMYLISKNALLLIIITFSIFRNK